MKLTNWYDSEEFRVDGVCAVLEQYEHATVVLPSGHRVDVFDDSIRVSEPGAPKTRDGKVVWRK